MIAGSKLAVAQAGLRFREPAWDGDFLDGYGASSSLRQREPTLVWSMRYWVLHLIHCVADEVLDRGLLQKAGNHYNLVPLLDNQDISLV